MSTFSEFEPSISLPGPLSAMHLSFEATCAGDLPSVVYLSCAKQVVHMNWTGLRYKYLARMILFNVLSIIHEGKIEIYFTWSPVLANIIIVC